MKALYFAIFFIFSHLWVIACGVSWSPSNAIAFDGINAMGEVDITERLGYIDIDGENQIDLSLNFNSNRKTASKIFGYGWWFGLTDSYIVKDTQDSYKFVMPDNDNIILKRSYKNKKLFETKSKNWILEEIPNGFSVTGSCGVIFIFKRNFLDQVKYSNGTTLFFKYEGGNLKQINAKGTPIVLFRYDKRGTIYMDFAKEKRTIRFKVSEVSGYGKLLAEQVDFPNAKRIKEYSYKFSNNGVNEISITQNDETKKYFWEANNGLIKKEESYKNNRLADSYEYTIPNKTNVDKYKYLKRKSSSNKKEDIFYRNDKGVSVNQRNGGDIVKIYENMSANCYGKPRKIETKYPDGRIEEQLFLYDDKGRIIREVKDGKILFNVKRNDYEHSISYFDGNWALIWKKFFDEQNRVISYEKSDGSKTTFKYLKNGEIEATLVKNGKSTTRIFNENLTIIKCLNANIE